MAPDSVIDSGSHVGGWAATFAVWERGDMGLLAKLGAIGGAALVTLRLVAPVGADSRDIAPIISCSPMTESSSGTTNSMKAQRLIACQQQNAGVTGRRQPDAAPYDLGH